jgi:hypothetical protein
VVPPDIHFSYIASFFIIAPTLYVLIYSNIQQFGLKLGLVVDVLHALSMLNVLRILFKCAYTEPGIIPAVPTTAIDQNVNH